MKRDKEISRIRPILALDMNGGKTVLEEFMHDTLRPVLKMQHDLIIMLLKGEQHLNLDLLYGSGKTQVEKHHYLTEYVQKNNLIKHTLTGIIIGVFTANEMTFYLENKKRINKRLLDMIVTRFTSTLN